MKKQRRRSGKERSSGGNPGGALNRERGEAFDFVIGT
jgi:hypothetical protein